MQAGGKSAGSADFADLVTLSQAAQEGGDGARVSAVQQTTYSKGVHASGAQADETARVLAYTVDRPLLDLTDFAAGTGPMRYAATGEPVTPESESTFNAEAQKLRDARVSIYENEKAKGMSGADITDQLIAFMSSQPKEFTQHTGWNNLIPGSR
jgi:hypothetical protein